MTTFTPTSAAEVLDTVKWAVSEETTLELLGSGTKRGIGRPVEAEHVLDLTGLTGVTLYEPEELVLSARAGTPLAEIEALLEKHGQQLAFEPMDCSALLGSGGSGTLGGTLAANLAGPRRLKAGSARDHVLGIAAVSGRGDAFKSGGRVVKNVTGYDLSKAMAGSWGTLAAVTDVTFKVLPAAEDETTLALRGLTDEQASVVMSAAMGSSAEVSSAAHLPEGVAGSVTSLGYDAATLVRVEGFGPSVKSRVDLLKKLFADAREIELHSGKNSRALWRGIRDCAPFADGTEKPVWRISVAPTAGHDVALAIRQHAPATVFYDWQGGLVWMRMEGDAEASLVRQAVAKFGGGHATLLRAPVDVRNSVPVFHPQPTALSTLSARLRKEFDPRTILNPGRMYATA
ncbi:glycolate oxidase subunit GlcE [Mesorhizobium sp. Z1-4]|uniref:glycolate oxidase subunit GlcE n=1 Tax=Mesorhizobium sp. Z1-4 TaxID=2448478 RepID=UPI000FD996F2|nr:glycolate oxidase subunit GlcE [Mesorhizobium sp. Z1-4]